jgi:hypothetical protein
MNHLFRLAPFSGKFREVNTKNLYCFPNLYLMGLFRRVLTPLSLRAGCAHKHNCLWDPLVLCLELGIVCTERTMALEMEFRAQGKSRVGLMPISVPFPGSRTFKSWTHRESNWKWAARGNQTTELAWARESISEILAFCADSCCYFSDRFIDYLMIPWKTNKTKDTVTQTVASSSRPITPRPLPRIVWPWRKCRNCICNNKLYLWALQTAWSLLPMFKLAWM